MTHFPDLPFETSMIFAPNIRISATKKHLPGGKKLGGVSMCFLQTKKLGGGFKYFLFLSLFGEMIQFD